MKKATKPTRDRKGTRRAPDDLRAEYDFRGGTRGKYAERFADWTYLVMLDPDIASQFPSERAVNRALWAYLRIAMSF